MFWIVVVLIALLIFEDRKHKRERNVIGTICLMKDGEDIYPYLETNENTLRHLKKGDYVTFQIDIQDSRNKQ